MSGSGVTKPLPVIDDGNRPFWDGCAAASLRLQRCAECGHLRYPINAVCPRCLAAAHSWDAVSGRGTVYSTIVFHQVYHEAFRPDVPYNVAMIELAEGPRMISNVTGVPPAAVRVGDAVTVWFDRVTAEVAIPRFRPVEGPVSGADVALAPVGVASGTPSSRIDSKGPYSHSIVAGGLLEMS